MSKSAKPFLLARIGATNRMQSSRLSVNDSDYLRSSKLKALKGRAIIAQGKRVFERCPGYDAPALSPLTAKPREIASGAATANLSCGPSYARFIEGKRVRVFCSSSGCRSGRALRNVSYYTFLDHFSCHSICPSCYTKNRGQKQLFYIITSATITRCESAEMLGLQKKFPIEGGTITQGNVLTQSKIVMPEQFK